MASRLTLNETEKAYIAGFFDGEGTVGIRQRKRAGVRTRQYWECNVAVVNTNEDIVLWMQSRIGGSIYKATSKNEKHKPTYQLKLRSSEAQPMLSAILPYLKVKRTQADLVLVFLRDQHAHPVPGKKGHPESVINFRKDLYALARDMDRTGTEQHGATQ